MAYWKEWFYITLTITTHDLKEKYLKYNNTISSERDAEILPRIWINWQATECYKQHFTGSLELWSLSIQTLYKDSLGKQDCSRCVKVKKYHSHTVHWIICSGYQVKYAVTEKKNKKRQVACQMNKQKWILNFVMQRTENGAGDFFFYFCFCVVFFF